VWLHQALIKLNNITTGLQQHGLNWHESEHVKLYTDILQVPPPPPPPLGAAPKEAFLSRNPRWGRSSTACSGTSPRTSNFTPLVVMSLFTRMSRKVAASRPQATLFSCNEMSIDAFLGLLCGTFSEGCSIPDA
jgi:hypothetical protein